MFIVPHKERFCSFELFPSASLLSSHDHLVKMWDQRSHKTPLFELTGIIECRSSWGDQVDITLKKTTLIGLSFVLAPRDETLENKKTATELAHSLPRLLLAEMCHHHNWKPKNCTFQATLTKCSVVTGLAVRY